MIKIDPPTRSGVIFIPKAVSDAASDRIYVLQCASEFYSDGVCASIASEPWLVEQV
jgi:hypothetical protein